jgi:hypothetical protein
MRAGFVGWASALIERASAGRRSVSTGASFAMRKSFTWGIVLRTGYADNESEAKA